MTATDHNVMTLRLALPGKTESLVQELLDHEAVRRYLLAGWKLQTHGCRVKKNVATVPMVAPVGWPENWRGDF